MYWGRREFTTLSGARAFVQSVCPPCKEEEIVICPDKPAFEVRVSCKKEIELLRVFGKTLSIP